MVEVIINGTSIDLISEEVKYTRQANDLADISTVNASFTYSLRVDKTPRNTQIFQQLGMVGDTSQTPYATNTAQLIDNGAILIGKGIAFVKETSSEYKMFIQEGIVEVFKIIENRTLGNDLNLSELAHSKNAASIIGSWNGFTPYRYLIADYNGRMRDGSGIDSEYQVPSVSVKYLWDKVFDFLGYSYSGDFTFIENKWITYPKPPEISEGEPERAFSGMVNSYSGPYNNAYKHLRPLFEWEEFTVLDNWRMRANFTGIYRILWLAGGFIKLKMPTLVATLRYRADLLINGEVVASVMANSYDPEDEKPWEGPIQSGDIVEMRISVPTGADIERYNFPQFVEGFLDSGSYEVENLEITQITILIDNLGREDINFREALSEFSIRDFFKEVMFRGALTPFVDTVERHIDFLSLKERLVVPKSQVRDLSSKYVQRTNESYTFGSYAQKNILSLKYDNQEQNDYDGHLYVENKNIQSEKILFTSKFFAPDPTPSTVLFSASNEGDVPLIKLWDKNIKETSEGEQEIEYKPMNNRFFWLGAANNSGVISVDGYSNSGFYTASKEGVGMQDVVRTKYKESDLIFTDTRIHDIELALSANDFRMLDLRNLYYFEQEGQFYLLNKVIWETGKIAKGEFLRVKMI